MSIMFESGKLDLKDAPQAGHPKTVLTDKNIEAVEQLLNEDGRYTMHDISQTLDISCDWLHIIITKNLKGRKICAKWVPNLLTEEQKANSVKCAKKLLKMCQKSGKCLYLKLLTGDETWIYYHEPDRKVNNKMWLTKNPQY